MKTKLLLSGIAALFLATGAVRATEDFCLTVTKTPDGFLALREGPGTQFKMIAKIFPGYPLDADTGGGSNRNVGPGKRQWTRVWIAARKSAWVYNKYTQPRDCPED